MRKILQLYPSPLILDAKNFENPLSNSNPNGSLTALYAFRNLVDTIPIISPYYISSGASLEDVYGLILNNAVSVSNSDFLKDLIAQSKQSYKINALQDMDLTPGVWRPVYSSPENWYDLNNNELYQTIELEDLIAKFETIGNPISNLKLLINDSILETDVDFSSLKIKFDYLIVDLIRPWLSPIIFDTKGWLLQGQKEGICSSGELFNNNGLLPLITTSILVAKNVDFSTDSGLNNSNNSKVSLGPFVLDSNTASSLYMIGRISSLVPLSPIPSEPAQLMQWKGKNLNELKDSLKQLSGIIPTSIVIVIENYTNFDFLQINIFKKSGVIKDPPPTQIFARSFQGFSTYFDLDGGPEGWIVFSFNKEYNLILYWQNFLLEPNFGEISFISKKLSLSEESIGSFMQENILRETSGFVCSTSISSGFQGAVFKYSISTID